VSREGAFLANNVLFAAFAFVVLVGTVFPLVAEALNGDRLSVGGPYFDRMTMPVGFLLLFLMAVAPALPWRKASGELLRRRLLVPAWVATITAVGVVALGYRGPAALLAFTLGAFAAAAALRQLVLAAAASRRQGNGLLRGLVGRANGGMVVHLGVVLIAVAFAASHAYRAGGEFRMTRGRSVEVAGHRVTYLGTTRVARANKTSLQARVRVDGGKVFSPALHEFPFATQAIGSPSVKTGLFDDVYLTLVAGPEGGSTTATIGVIVQPLIAWLWIGGSLMAVGTFLAAWPGRRRRQPAPAAVPAAGERVLEPAVVG
jgi:cytochrome c-type biogenesis protein CcmF